MMTALQVIQIQEFALQGLSQRSNSGREPRVVVAQTWYSNAAPQRLQSARNTASIYPLL
jgi:hypothetical protein